MPMVSWIMGDVEVISTASYQLLLTNGQSERQNIAEFHIAVSAYINLTDIL